MIGRIKLACTGVLLGMIAGCYGDILDEIIVRIVDILLAFPGLGLALAIAGLLGPGLFNVMFALAIVGWMGYARVVRGIYIFYFAIYCRA